MIKPIQHKPNPILIISLLCALLFAYAGRGLTPSYSYWSDEMWSVGAAMESWTDMFRLHIIPDSAPPLYQTILKIWVGLFGIDETSTRTLSLICASLGLCLMSWLSSLIKHKSLFNRITALCFLGLSPAFSYYAQTTRNYGMLLGISTVFCTLALARRQINAHNQESSNSPLLESSYYFSGILLSLCHYFGLIFAFFIIGVDQLNEFRKPGRGYQPSKGLLLFMLLSFTWPTYQVFIANGSASEYIRSSAANIDTTPFWGTLISFLSGCFPILGIYGFVAFALAFTAWLLLDSQARSNAYAWWLHSVSPYPQTEVQWLAARIVGFLLFTSMIDIFKPISLGRNLIVLLPLLAFAFADGIEWLKKRRGALPSLALASGILIALAANGGEKLSRKQFPMQNPRAPGEFVIQSGICMEGCLSSSTSARSTIYLPNIPLAEAPSPDGALILDKPLVEWEGGSHSKPYLEAALAANKDATCWEGKQVNRTSTFILMRHSDAARTAPQLHGLVPCREKTNP